MSTHAITHCAQHRKRILWGAGLIAIAVMLATLFSQGNPQPIDPQISGSAAILEITVLVFREGLECILVLAAVTASMSGEQQSYRRPVALGAGIGFAATLVTWSIAARILDNLSRKIPALDVQAATGLLAIVILLIVMNWFFHKIYWTGWISLHNRRKQELLNPRQGPMPETRIVLGLGMLGFTSLYREGFEVVLFLQSYRLKLGAGVVYTGVLLGLIFTAAVGMLTFVAHRRLPYRKMLVLTGIMLGLVLFVMVGEQAQEMQLAHWLPTTTIPWLANKIPWWMGLWLSIFPTLETLAGQAIALALVLGSYFLAQRRSHGGTS